MSGMQIRAFRPLGINKTVNVAVTAASQTLVIPDVPFGTRAVRMVNVGSQLIFIDFIKTGSTGTANIATSIPVLPNTIESFTVGNNIGFMVVVASAVGSTLYITYGEGI